MIYSKEATFPYPVLTNGTDAYTDNRFVLDIDLQENVKDYYFSFTYELSSEYLKQMISSRAAALLLVIRSKDNKFYPVTNNQPIVIPKSRISLNKRTSIQLIVRAENDLDFSSNTDIVPFYDEFRSGIHVPRHGVLALSNVVVFDGSNKKPYDLFEKRVQSDIRSDIQIDLGPETIIICYRNEELQFVTSPNSRTLNYPYIYMGLQKALTKMLEELSENDDGLDIAAMDVPENGLYIKLYTLMKAKKVVDLNQNNLDEVIYMISDRIIERFTQVIKGIQDNGN